MPSDVPVRQIYTWPRIPTIDIMKLTGHKTESELLKYIKVTKEETAYKLLLHPYFSGK